MQDVFFDAMQQLLASRCQPAQVRAIEQSGDGAALWSELAASGFLDALVAERRGGSGLGLADVFSVVFAGGRHALPLPFGHTLLVRGLWEEHGPACPTGPITIAAAAQRRPDGALDCAQVPFGRVSDWVLADLDGGPLLLPAAAAARTPAGGHGSLDADLHWSAPPPATIALSATHDWRALGALASAALLAGAQERVFELTLAYANERSQFGKPIGKFQAIQQQLSVMAEHVFAAKMAAQIGFSLSPPSALCAAVAKARASEAAPVVAAIAHAVHGAMGFTEEYDLQLYTRRLHEWRMAYGSESFWNHRLGSALLATAQAHALDFVRADIMAAGGG